MNVNMDSKLLEALKRPQELLWINPNLNEEESPLANPQGIKDAAARLNRFAPYFKKEFPETSKQEGLIESPLTELKEFPKVLQKEGELPLRGRLFLKQDNVLPISGSIKARGGIYEILCLAETIALKSGKLSLEDDYALLANPQFKELFSQYQVGVGSTGNLGLSIGIISAKLGFQVTVHMSNDARAWKKDLLRQKGAKVVEYPGNFEMAISEGRKQAALNPNCHFVDDENSMNLFYGYSVAAERTARQMEELGLKIDEEHPLFVYLPCGVGGGPGGVTYGFKQIFGPHVHCIFVEPTNSPCMLLGLATGLHDGISVMDIGLSGQTAMDGLAVSRPSKLIGRIVGHRIDGIYTLQDEKTYKYLLDLWLSESIVLEPSACASLPGIKILQEHPEYSHKFSSIQWQNSVHIAWATGGGMVPAAEMEAYRQKGRDM